MTGPGTTKDDGSAAAEPTEIDLLIAGMEQLERSNGELSDRVDGVAGQVDEILDYLTARPGGPWHWAELSGEETAALWGQLFEWVTWLDNRYVQYLGQDRFGLRPCWYKHPIIIEHLTALMVSHAGTYRVSKSSPSPALVDWQVRSLWPTLERISTLWNKCTLREHFDPHEKAHPLAVDEADFEKFVNAGTAVTDALATTRRTAQMAREKRIKKRAAEAAGIQASQIGSGESL